ILVRCLRYHLWRQRRSGWTSVPSGAGEIIAYVLLVKTRLAVPRSIPLQRPETRRIGREDFVDEGEMNVQKPKFKLRVSNDDPARQRIVHSLAIEPQTGVTHLFCECLASSQDGHHLGKRDIEVMLALRRFRRGGKERLGQAFRLLQPRRQP